MNRTTMLVEALPERDLAGGVEEWWLEAPCRAVCRPNGPFSHIHEHGRTSRRCSLCNEARSICASCPFVFECLSEVVADAGQLLSSDIRKSVPIRAGFTGRQQYQLVKRLRGDDSAAKTRSGTRQPSVGHSDRHGLDRVSGNGAGAHTRRLILERLESGPGTLRSLSEQLGIPRDNVRYHLRRLRRAGVVSADSRPGAATRYELAAS